MRAWVAALLIVAVWTVFGVLSASQMYVQRMGDHGSAAVRSVFHVVYFYWAWAAVTPLVLLVARRVRSRPVLALAGGACLVLPLQALIYSAWSGGTFRNALVFHGAGNLLTYLVVIGLWSGAEYYRRGRRASELEAVATQAQLRALRAQIHPHFLFNALNTISTLVIKGDARAATRGLARLGDLLRAALETSATAEATLAHELEFTRHYLEIERLRFGDRLTVVEQIDDHALNSRLPSLILQPLVENAVRHGRSRIEIEASRQDADLIVRVRDDGPGFAPGASSGVGLSNTRERLALLYGTRARLSTENGANGGALVTLVVPV
jgi:two-component system, LytTR family, sensor kinase